MVGSLIRRVLDNIATQAVYFGTSYWYARSRNFPLNSVESLQSLADAMDLAANTIAIAKGEATVEYVEEDATHLS